MLYLIERYSRELIKEHHDTIFVFGDNLFRIGLGGQAAAARYEPNSLGIVTKVDPEVCYYENDLERWIEHSNNDFRLLREFVMADKDVVLPVDGIGTGLADLKNKAPAILDIIDSNFDELVFDYLVKINQIQVRTFNYLEKIITNDILKGSRSLFENIVNEIVISDSFDTFYHEYHANIVINDQNRSLFMLLFARIKREQGKIIWNITLPYFKYKSQ